ncbi:MAG: hypothetical protein ABSF23_01345 [Terracidiphilus sp.]|jgi:hypothetical protein
MPRANELAGGESIPAPPILPPRINATRTIVSVLGILLAIGGIDHGAFETLQGNITTPGLFIHSIGPGQQMWPYGTEDALTLIPNYLASGLVSIALSLAIALWSIGFIHRKHGSAAFLLLCIALFLSGGGVAQVVFFMLAWAVSLRIHKPLRWPQRLLPRHALSALGRLWPACLALFTLLFLAALEIAIVGYVPGVNNSNLAQHICWSLLAIGLAILIVAISSAFAHDSARNE